MRSKLIQDVQTPHEVQLAAASKLTTDLLVEALYNRGITITRIYSQYIAMEAIDDARSDELFGNGEEGQHGRPNVTAAEAELARVPTPDPNDKPF